MLLLTLISLIHTNHSFNKKQFTILSKKQTLSLLPPQWYYVHINSFKDINQIKSLLPNLKMSPLEFNGDYLTLFLTPNEARLINQIPNINIYTKNPKKVTFSTEQKNETYLVYAHSSFTAPTYSQTISRSGPFYFVSTSQPTRIENDPSVLSIKKVPHFHTMNRWTTGFLQSGNQDYIIKNGYYTSNRKYNDRGLNGSNVIVTLIDSGTDVNNCLFNDPKYPTPYNETNLNHRKIVRYDPFADGYDKVIGHGTHCAGIIAGSTESLPMSLYNGQAPAAKLYVADIGFDSNKSIDVSFTFDIFQQSIKLNSPIISCSWGAAENTPEFTQMFDYLSYENPSHLFVFAAGNDYSSYTIGSPANSKNVLTIASSYPTRSFYLEDKSHIVKIVDGNEQLTVTSTNVFSTMKKHEISYLDNIELITYNENLLPSEYANKAVVIYRSYPYSIYYKKIFDTLASNNAKVAIVFDVYSANHDDIAVLTTSSSNKAFFARHNKISITIDIPTTTKEMTAADYSSKGPSVYGNRKPDIMAPGTSIYSASNFENSNECTAKSSLVEMSGTSMATPAVSGSLALVYQYLKEGIHGLNFDKSNVITSALLRAFAIAGSGDKADIEQGYGNLNLSRILIYPNLDFGSGLRFYSDKINHNEFISFFVKTNHVGSLSVSLAWIDVPINLQSLYPLFSYFEFYLIGPDGNVYDVEEQFSTSKKIVINDAPIGTYEIRLRMNQIVPSEYSVDYSLVIVGPFDHLNFINNPSGLKPSTPKSCSSKCPSDKCNSQTATCVCDKLHTGTNCEFEVIDVSEGIAIHQVLKKRDFLYTRLDASKYKNMKQSEIEKLTLTIKTKSDRFSYSNGIIRFFFNTDNSMPLSIPAYFVQLQGEVTSSFSIPLSDITQMEDVYLTIFNDYGIDISFYLNWTVKKSLTTKNSEIELRDIDLSDDSSKFTQTKAFKISMLVLIVVGCVAIVSVLVVLIVKTVNKKNSKKHNNNNYQQYTDATSNNQLNVTLVDDV